MAQSEIEKNKIAEFLTAVSADYAIYGPKAKDGVIAFGSIDSAAELILDYTNSAISAKELFFPRTEVVYEFDGNSFVDNVSPEQKRVIIGMRPCDCRALTLLDFVFEAEAIKDPFYVTRRQNTVVIGLGCNSPLSSCFCTVLGGDPFGQDGADILLGDVGDLLLAKAVTPKGSDFMKCYDKFFSAGRGADWDKQADLARNKIESRLETKDIKSCLDERFENDIWETVSHKCLGCGACSYMCPTCYCFDLVNDKTAAGSKKVRKWDCCMFSLFTRHASGHNPRSVNSARLRQKIMHKFSYYPERYGINGCVGCGRCVRGCPVNLDIRGLLEDVTAAPKAATE